MERLSALRSRLSRSRTAVEQRKGELARLQLDRDRTSAELVQFLEQQQLFEQVSQLLQQTAEHAREQARANIEGLVGSTLQAIFGPSYGFRIEMTEKAGRPEAEFYVLSEYQGEMLKTRPQDSRGGGVVDVLSLGLRIAMLETYRPRLQGPMLLDEPAKHVSEEYIQATADLLQRVADSFGRQVIMVTHSTHLAESGTVAYRVHLQDKGSVVSRIGRGGV
jgi:DNA repair exonuclease SbcCD ATPase subunit